MKIQTSVSVEENLRNRVAEAAAAEGSSFSAMWALLVELGFTVRDQAAAVPQALTKTIGLSAPLLANFSAPLGSAKTTRAPSKPVAERKGLCEHRNPPTTFCKFCDR